MDKRLIKLLSTRGWEIRGGTPIASELIQQYALQITRLERQPLNADTAGLCRTIKAQYYKNGRANFKEVGGHGATGVIEWTE